MEKNLKLATKSNKRLISILAGVTTLLFVPLIAMQLTDDVKWTLLDFIAAGILLLGAGLTLEYILRKVQVKYRIVACIALFIVLLFIWAELAVGIFGTPFGGQ